MFVGCLSLHYDKVVHNVLEGRQGSITLFCRDACIDLVLQKPIFIQTFYLQITSS